VGQNDLVIRFLKWLHDPVATARGSDTIHDPIARALVGLQAGSIAIG
jgi:hypothetical protein